MKLGELYERLRLIHGELGKWWPGTREEILITAILTQNTNWKNVEKAMENLKKVLGDEENLLPKLHNLSREELAVLIKPSGFFNVKASRLKNLLALLSLYDFNLERLGEIETGELRKLLLNVEGIGEETADAILLYAFEKPVFVVDSYTRRILERVFGEKPGTYEQVQRLFMTVYPPSVPLYQELHGLIVEHAKKFCTTKPKCDVCPIAKDCKTGGSFTR